MSFVTLTTIFIYFLYRTKYHNLYILMLREDNMFTKNIQQKISIKTDVKKLGSINEMETSYTDKYAIESMARRIIKKHLGIDVMANYIEAEKVLIINEVGI